MPKISLGFDPDFSVHRVSDSPRVGGGGWVEGRQEVGIRPKGNSQDVPLPCLALSSGAAPVPTLPEGITGISCL